MYQYTTNLDSVICTIHHINININITNELMHFNLLFYL